MEKLKCERTNSYLMQITCVQLHLTFKSFLCEEFINWKAIQICHSFANVCKWQYCSNIRWIYTHLNVTAKIRTRRLLVDYTLLWFFSWHYSRSWGWRVREEDIPCHFILQLQDRVVSDDKKNNQQTTCCIRYRLFSLSYLYLVLLRRNLCSWKHLSYVRHYLLAAVGTEQSDRPGCKCRKCFSLFEW